ncbi:MAG: hypothetical protein QGG73_10560 [Candidatus Hydrogenedentes bacterium]|nr:hypothetical protein [Candidatus Hydrogenedentota bacterium]
MPVSATVGSEAGASEAGYSWERESDGSGRGPGSWRKREDSPTGSLRDAPGDRKYNPTTAKNTTTVPKPISLSFMNTTPVVVWRRTLSTNVTLTIAAGHSHSTASIHDIGEIDALLLERRIDPHTRRRLGPVPLETKTGETTTVNFDFAE